MAKGIETSRQRAALAREAGLPKLSPISALAGVLVAYGASMVLLAVGAWVARVGGASGRLPAGSWRTLGSAGAILVTVPLLLSYLFGGYVAGRMARRAGWLHGLAAFLLALLVAMVLGALVASQRGSGDLVANVRGLGIPTSWSDLVGAMRVAAGAPLVAMLVGSVLGGALGERWHAKLATRARAPRRARRARSEGDRHDDSRNDRPDHDRSGTGRTGT